MGGSSGLVVIGGDSCPKVVGSNPSTVYWMDIIWHLFVVEIVMFVWKDENEQKKRLALAHFLKKTICFIFRLNLELWGHNTDDGVT